MEAQVIGCIWRDRGQVDRDRHWGPAPSPADCRQTGHPACVPLLLAIKVLCPVAVGSVMLMKVWSWPAEGCGQGAVGSGGGVPSLTTSVYGTSAKSFSPMGLSPFLSEAVRKKAAVGTRGGTHSCGTGAAEAGSSHPIHDPPGATAVAWEEGCGCGRWCEECKWGGRCQAILCPQCVLEGILGRTVPSSAPVPTMGPAAPSMAPANASLDGSAKTAHRVSCCPPGKPPTKVGPRTSLPLVLPPPRAEISFCTWECSPESHRVSTANMINS